MQALPLYLDLPEAILVHGYLEPNIPLEAQHPFVLCGTMTGEKILRERYDRPWYELYAGRKPVVVGHRDYVGSGQPFVYKERVFGLDTGCVTGKALTGLLLPSFRIISVPSRGNLWLQVRRAYQKPAKPAKSKPPPISWDEEGAQALVWLVAWAQSAHENLFHELHAQDDFNALTARQQAKAYAEAAGSGPQAVLLQLARLGRLDVQSAQRVLREPGRAHALITKLQGR